MDKIKLPWIKITQKKPTLSMTSWFHWNFAAFKLDLLRIKEAKTKTQLWYPSEAQGRSYIFFFPIIVRVKFLVTAGPR